MRLADQYDPEDVTGEDFELLLQYLVGLQGAARKLTHDKAEQKLQADTEMEGAAAVAERAQQVLRALQSMQ